MTRVLIEMIDSCVVCGEIACERDLLWVEEDDEIDGADAGDVVCTECAECAS